jgi:transcription-repair coupling factor (superfamily II helicase)
VSVRNPVVLDAIASTPAFRSLLTQLPRQGEERRVGGVAGSTGPALVAALHQQLRERIILLVARSPQTAAALEADLEALLEEGEVRLYPQREALPYEAEERHLEVGGLRVEAVEALLTGRTRVLVTTLRALQERAPVPDRLNELRLTLDVGEAWPFALLEEELVARGFEKVPLVEEVGQFAVRGGILDVFSFGAPEPVRIEFWGDEIASIRHFDIMDQRSTATVESVHLLPVDFTPREGGEGSGQVRSLLELLPADALLIHPGEEPWLPELRRSWQQVLGIRDERRAAHLEAHEPGDLFLSPEAADALLRRFPRIALLEEEAGGGIELGARPAPPIERDMDRLRELLRTGAARGARTLILCDNDGQLQRLEELLGGGAALPPGTALGVGSLDRGFVLESSTPPLQLFTDHEIFRRTRRLRRTRRFRGAVALESLAQLSPGDYVVHMDHGIGCFRGLHRVTIAGEEIEAASIEYANGEILRVPVYRLDLLERWTGDTDASEPPPVHKIGGKKWKALRRRTEEAIEAMALEMIQLHARREAGQGFAFSPDTLWQKEMESSFLYEDTPDQRKATADVKRDMESARPMDRLVCGDVGYGKTEVAVRAAFKAVQDARQVAVLAPTTILVEQHRRTLEARLADYPVRIEALSRFRSPKEVKEILTRLERGEVDIIVGTHRLLSDDVRFANLGLLIVDEEQRFGVKHKDRLKELRASIDVLTLTATPIPRTLQLSLSGLRSLTLIQTPPRDRLPVITHVLPWSNQILGEAVWRELDRGGQVYVLHNRIETIELTAQRFRELAPEARVEVAHGQMGAGPLEEIMTRFVEGETDILVSSAIIENGLDVPNANTLIVDRADRFGLSQLYQIRGRVGRSDRRAYCYLVVPDSITEDAEKRLRVMEHYTELGSGYHVALRDLELRGAGNLLGADQSGFAVAVGMDTYLRLLEQTVQRVKRGEGNEQPAGEVDVSMEGSAFLPDSYIPDPGQKLHLYRRLSRLEGHADVQALREELVDRFGPLPPEVERLVDTQTLRLLGKELGIERISLQDRSGRITFRADANPRMSALDRPFRERQIHVEVRRVDPLSLGIRKGGVEPLAPTLIRALSALVEGKAVAA